MRHLQSSSDTEDKKVLDAFIAGDFSCQKTDIPDTAIGRDYAGEQENCKIKNCGGIEGITTNENSRTRHLLVAPILCPISEVMLKIRGAISSLPKQHHQLNAFCTDRQNKRVSSLKSI